MLTNRIEKELTLLVSKNAHVDIPFNSVDVAATVAGRSKQPGLQVISRAWGVTKKVGKKLAGEVFGVSRCDVQDCESYWGRLRREE